MMQWWSKINRALEYPAPPGDDHEIIMELPQYIRALAETCGSMSEATTKDDT